MGGELAACPHEHNTSLETVFWPISYLERRHLVVRSQVTLFRYCFTGEKSFFPLKVRVEVNLKICVIF